jgi:hypothetical protein
MYDWKRKLWLAAAFAIGLHVASSIAVAQQDVALRFRGSLGAVSPVLDSSGDGWFSIGPDAPVYATVSYTNMEYQIQDGDTPMGTETFVTDFGDGDVIEWACRFVTENTTSPLGVSGYSDICHVATGKGIFQGASGMAVGRGAGGPGFSLYGTKLDGQTWYFIADYDGTITGVDQKALAHKLKVKPMVRPQFLMLRRGH